MVVELTRIVYDLPHDLSTARIKHDGPRIWARATRTTSLSAIGADQDVTAGQQRGVMRTHQPVTAPVPHGSPALPVRDDVTVIFADSSGCSPRDDCPRYPETLPAPTSQRAGRWLRQTTFSLWRHLNSADYSLNARIAFFVSGSNPYSR